MIEDVVKNIGGDHVDAIVLVKGELDPHTYQLVKGDDEKLAFSQLIFFNGLGLEHGPSLREYLKISEKAIGVGDHIYKEFPDQILRYNGTIDPHIWMDMSMWMLIIDPIVEALSNKDPDHRNAYLSNGQKLFHQLRQKHWELKSVMGKVPDEKRYLVTSHDAFNYFARNYLATDEERKNGTWNQRFQAPEGLAPDSQLSTTDIRLIIEHMKKYDIETIFPESNVSQSSIRKLLDAGREEGLKLNIASDYLYGDAMGGPGSDGDTYSKMIEHNVRTIAKFLK